MKNKEDINKNKYLTFRLANETYALTIVNAQSVMEKQKITRLPKTPDFIEGIINLRGQAVPIINLHKRFNLEKQKDTVNTSIIILEVQPEELDKHMILGVIVDAVKEVVEISGENIEALPDFGASIDTKFINGMGRINKDDDQFIIILNAEKLFSAKEMNIISETSSE